MLAAQQVPIPGVKACIKLQEPKSSGICLFQFRRYTVKDDVVDLKVPNLSHVFFDVSEVADNFELNLADFSHIASDLREKDEALVQFFNTVIFQCAILNP